MKRHLSLLFLLLLAALPSFAGIFISEPQDELVTFKEIVLLKGNGRDLKILKVNNYPINFTPESYFACGLVLKFGKNYAEVRALNENQEHFIKNLHLLRLKTYNDVEEEHEGQKHWARNQIVYLSTLGYIEGYPDGYFYPGNPITRGEMASWIVRIKNLKLPTLSEDVFFDVPKEHWRAPYIKAVVDQGYMKEYPNQTFGIDDPVARWEAAEIAVAVEGPEVIEKIKPLFIKPIFRDVPRGDPESVPVYAARKRGLVIGVSDEMPIYDPNRALTRAEAAVLLARFDRAIADVRDLFDFKKGYTAFDYAKLNVAPQIASFSIKPQEIQVGKEQTLELLVRVALREGFYPISKVKVDLSQIGGLPDTELFDDGKHGDSVKGDLIYSLSVSLIPKEQGQKFLTATVIDRLAWESKKTASLLILD